MSGNLRTSESDLSNRHTKLAWSVFGLLSLGLLGSIVFLYSVDGPVPNDANMMPHFMEGGGRNNALAVFLQKINGATRLAVTEPLLRSSVELLNQPKEAQDKYLSDNAKVLEALDELFNSSNELWRYNLQDTLVSPEFPEWPLTYIFINALHAYHFRISVHLEHEEYDVVILQCQKLLEAANGIENAEGVTGGWKVSDVARGAALDVLGRLVVLQDLKTDKLRQVKAFLEKEINHPWQECFMQAMQMDYLFFKKIVSYIKNHPSEASHILRLNPDRVSWFVRENKTLKLYIDYQKPIFQELVKGNSAQSVINKFEVRRQAFDLIEYSQLESLKPNATGLFLVVDFLSDNQNYFIDRVEAQAEIEVLYIMLAMRLYELTHHKLPDKLEELTPEFILPSFKDSQNFKELRWSKDDMKIYRKNMMNAAHHRDPVIKTEFDYLWELLSPKQ